MNDDDLICGENWDHDLEFEYDDDGFTPIMAPLPQPACRQTRTARNPRSSQQS